MIYIFVSTLILTIWLTLAYIRHHMLIKLHQSYRRSTYSTYHFLTLALFLMAVVGLMVTAGFTLNLLGVAEIKLAVEKPLEGLGFIFVPYGAWTMVHQYRLHKRLKPAMHAHDNHRRFGTYVVTVMTAGSMILFWLLYVQLIEAAWLFG